MSGRPTILAANMVVTCCASSWCRTGSLFMLLLLYLFLFHIFIAAWHDYWNIKENCHKAVGIFSVTNTLYNWLSTEAKRSCAFEKWKRIVGLIMLLIHEKFCMENYVIVIPWFVRLYVEIGIQENEVVDQQVHKYKIFFTNLKPSFN